MSDLTATDVLIDPDKHTPKVTRIAPADRAANTETALSNKATQRDHK